MIHLFPKQGCKKFYNGSGASEKNVRPLQMKTFKKQSKTDMTGPTENQ